MAEYKNIVFIYNPHSGKEQIKTYLYDIMQEFRKFDADIVVRPTVRRLDAYDYIKENAHRYDLVIVSGGDGTLNETVKAMMELGENKKPIAYIPSGTTNDFARTLGINERMDIVAKMIVEGEPRLIDVGSFGDTYFTYIAAVGAFTKVSYATPQSAKNIFGHQAYMIEAVKSLTDIKPMFLRIKTEHGMVEGDFIYGMISNSESVGGFKGFTGKYVSINDGIFEVTFVRYPNNPAQFQNMLTALLTQNYSSDMLYYDHINSVSVESDKEIPWVLDGEFGGDRQKVDISVVPNALEIVF
ncbi:MAG TPA: diacylglycerol kinase [Eubacterium sp.]|nr:diacylglycerol kinase [Eubacterium sp.]